MELSSVVYVLSLFEHFDLTTKRLLAKDVCICLNHAIIKNFDRGLPQFFAFGDLDKVLHGNALILRIWSWADNNKVYDYRLHFSSFPPLTDFALRRNRANTASDSSVLIAGIFLLQFTKPVIRLSKYVMEAAIKNAGHPGRRFLAASPPRARDHRGFAPRFHQTEKPNLQASQATWAHVKFVIHGSYKN